ncbi:uncharacterized protein si:ch211-198p11.6 isoform X1 [Hypomesus transpacificus]|uniref:uncharacterized protein si:ch211-198p11.6 isoform X1 n=1 Tax=Hypomesus transpacificus TaxID=137520 RepID=UPI001F085100|nr:uncharacterized protein si:ch211-198p11.6 isoform X1 [Hypomesus transpacificus]
MTQAGIVVLPIWGLALPLPAVLLIAVGLYMILLAMVLWFRHCLKDHCCSECGECCPNIAPFEYCIACAESCDCRFPSLRSFLDQMCPSPSSLQWPAWDCACTCQAPECESCNCLCFEIKVR